MVLDPIFIFGLNMQVAGAALATALSNTISLIYLLHYYVKSRESSLVKATFLPKAIDRHSFLELISIGTPAALQILLAALSNSVLLNLMSAYSATAISGVGVMQKVETIPFQIAQGISSGVLPLIAYNFAADNRRRMRDAVRFTISAQMVIAVFFFLLFEIFAAQVVGFFVPDAATITYGTAFLRLRLLGIIGITIEFTLIAVFQGIGGARQAFALSLFRKGIVDLPLMMLANHLWPMYGIMLVQPVMETCGAIIAIVMYRRLHRQIPKEATA